MHAKWPNLVVPITNLARSSNECLIPTLINKSKIFVPCSRPRAGCRKFNTDGSLRSCHRDSGISGVLQNKTGDILVMSSKTISVTDSTTAELLAVKEATIIYAVSRWCFSCMLILECDNCSVMKWLTDPNDLKWRLRALIFKGICDDLVAIRKLVNDRTKVFQLLRGLGLGYESFVTTMMKPPIPSFREIVPLLQGHETMKARFNQLYQAEIPSQALAALTIANIQDEAWHPDTGASSHMTADVGKLDHIVAYKGPDKIMDKETKQVVATGNRKGGLYALHPSKSSKQEAMFSNRFQFATAKVWHARLGHPHMRVIDTLRKQNLISSKDKCIDMEHTYTSCQMAKACRLPFLLRTEVCKEPLSANHCDLWGKAPILSHQKFNYYVIFIDEYTRFTWHFPLKNKSDFLQCFIDFHKYIENQFTKKLKVFQSDGGGEFSDTRFHAYLSKYGIKHRMSCPTIYE
ncbi:Uncharacterized protein TCM_040733 [Theobroma cacao]|uniref:Integrase catalytic domain-containing protein n=1 Tax=Theobroma cacao TaxID=3641 RepID=A0A061GTA9_THECC|nr:Uncharacterized protein TCM_040733 [Theobroma cacao]